MLQQKASSAFTFHHSITRTRITESAAEECRYGYSARIRDRTRGEFSLIPARLLTDSLASSSRSHSSSQIHKGLNNNAIILAQILSHKEKQMSNRDSMARCDEAAGSESRVLVIVADDLIPFHSACPPSASSHLLQHTE